MFTKPGKEDVSSPEPRATAEETAAGHSRDEAHTRSVSYLGPSLEFNGDVVVSEALIIEGSIEGSVTCKKRRLTIGKQGRVTGELHGEEVEVRGRVDGDIYGYERVRLHSTAVVGGTLHCKRIIMDDGAQLNGVVNMNVDRKGLAKKVVKSVDGKTGALASA